MTIDEIKALLETATTKFAEAKKENEQTQVQVKTLETKLAEMQTKFDKVNTGNDDDAKVKLADQINELQAEVSDLRTKAAKPAVAVIDSKAQKDALVHVARKAIGAFIKGKNGQNDGDFFNFIKQHAENQMKTLNITNAAQGGLAVAEILSREVLDYARELSPVVAEIGLKPAITRDYRQLIKVTYPSVQAGIENVAGSAIAETTTQTYNEVKARVFKLNAKPRITDEAMFGTDIDIYSDLVSSLGEEVGIYLAAQILFGNGTGKNARGILSSNRVNITDLTGESWKPTLGVGARSPDFYPAFATGVSGSLGATDVDIVNFVIDVCNTLPTRYLNGAKWYMNRKTKGLFEKVRYDDGKPVFTYDYIEGLPGRRLMLNGYPVVIDDTLPNVAANSLFAIFGRLDLAFAMNNGDIDKMLLDPYTVDGCTVIKMDKEFFEMAQRSDAILVLAATANGPT